MKKRIFIFSGLFIAVMLVCVAALRPVSEIVLRGAGFSQARIGSVSLRPEALTFKDISLKEGLSIGAVALAFDFSRLRIASLEITGLSATLDPSARGDGGGTSGSLPALLSRIDAVTLRGARINIVTPQGPLLVETEGALADTGDAHRWSAPFSATADFARAEGRFTLVLDKATGAAQAHVEIVDGKAALPGVELKRLAGWLSAETQPLSVNAQVTAGLLKIQGVPLQDAVFSLSSAPEKMQAVLNAATAGGAGTLMLDARLDRADPQTDRAALTLEARLSDGGALKVPGLEGSGALALSLSGTRGRDTAWTAWRDLKGAGKITAQGLSLPGLPGPAEAAGNVALGYTPETQALSLSLSGGHYAGPRLRARDARADLTVFLRGAAPAAEGEIVVGSFSAVPPVAVPLRLALRLRPEGKIAGEITEKNGLLSARISGQYGDGGKSGDVSVTMPPLTLQKGVTVLEDLFPAAAQYAEDVTGTLGFSARAAWKNGRTETSGEILLKNVSGTSENAVFSGISGVLAFDSLAPPVFRNQTLAVGLLNAGLPLTDGEITASRDAAGNIAVHGASWTLARGRLSAAPFTLPPGLFPADIVLTAEGLALEDLFRLAPLEGLVAVGRAGGTLPLALRDGKISIENGVLETAGGGAIRYNPAVPPAFLQNDDNRQIADLRVALKAFDYETLRLDIGGTLGGQQRIALHAAGRNPEFYGGHPVKINFNVEGPLQSVVKYSLGNNDIPGNVRKQIEAYEREHATR